MANFIILLVRLIKNIIQYWLLWEILCEIEINFEANIGMLTVMLEWK